MQRQTRAMERSSSMRRRREGWIQAKPRKVSRRGSGRRLRGENLDHFVIVEALKVDSLQKLCSSLEPILRRVVSEEVERALAKLGPAKIAGSLSDQIEKFYPFDASKFSVFQKNAEILVVPSLFTGGKVEGEQGAAIHVVLLDSNNGHVVTSGQESSLKLDIVVLEGDFNNEDDEGWTQEEFESHVVKEREGKRPLLTGDLQVTLKEGVGTVGDLTFTDNSSWIRSRKFRLGLKVASGYCEGIRIREAKTDAFTVKDHRGELYKKHYPPALSDDVWRLEKIGKDGSFHKRLNKAGIHTVEDFLRLVVRDSQKLRHILGSGMSNKMWEVLLEHAKTCALSGKLYIYHPDDTRNVGVVFNNIYELSGLIAGGQYYSADRLSESQKVYVDGLVKKAYENWMCVIEYDGKALLNFKQNKRSSTSHSEVLMNMPEYQPSFEQQVSLPRLPVSIPPEQQTIGSSLPHGSTLYNENQGARYSMQSENMNTNANIQYDGSSFTPQNQLIGSSQQTQMIRNDNMPPTLTYDDWPRNNRENRGMDDFFSEEEIRMRSHEMLENDDMQHLLRVFSMGGNGSVNASDDAYNFSSYMPSPATFSYEEDRTRSSGKAVVGWLKLKAALRWGIFIRKQAAEKAAERRAQLVELDD
ncbi:hypothetical protein Scep_023345 [Stephania cephalantha]|uniref:Calmodulin-binding protein n=1 Tax=Stephania cephalantha TaxID=152367 RepID=A0AAP0HXG8_9MAGN